MKYMGILATDSTTLTVTNICCEQWEKKQNIFCTKNAQCVSIPSNKRRSPRSVSYDAELPTDLCRAVDYRINSIQGPWGFGGCHCNPHKFNTTPVQAARAMVVRRSLRLARAVSSEFHNCLNDSLSRKP